MSTPSLEVRPVEKMVVMSDLHLGEANCVLNPRTSDSDHKNINDLVNAINGIGKVDELILLGDFLDLSLASTEEAYSNAKEFFSAFEDFTSVKRITYVPGNHDHHVWVQLIEQQEVIEKLNQGQTPTDKETLTRRSVRSYLDGRFLGKLLRSNHPPLIAEYPDIMRRCGDQHYYFTHGHYLEDFFTPITKFLHLEGRGGSLVDLEAFNCAWLEAGWYHMGQAGRLGDLIGGVYMAIRDGNEQEAEKVAEIIYELYLKSLVEEGWVGELPGVEEFLKRRIKKRIIKTSRMLSWGFSSMVDTSIDEEWKKEIRDYILQYVPGKSFPAFTFIFGHTHVKCDEKEKQELRWDGATYPLLNTGAWLVRKGKEKEV
ncbi:MAG TPA: metallophosphoesterase, partial [Candidatus Hypogeohydataceae bacterium YC38]